MSRTSNHVEGLHGAIQSSVTNMDSGIWKRVSLLNDRRNCIGKGKSAGLNGNE